MSPIGEKTKAKKNKNKKNLQIQTNEIKEEEYSSVPDIHKNSIMNKNTDTFQVSATGDSKIDSFVLVNTSYDTSKIKKIERNLINDTYIAQEEEKAVIRMKEYLGSDFSLVSPEKEDTRRMQRLEDIKESPQSIEEESKNYSSVSANSLRESLEKQRRKIESIKKKSEESKKLKESVLKINDNLQARIKRPEDNPEDESRLTVCFLRRTPGSMHRTSSQVKKEYSEKKEELFKTSEFVLPKKSPDSKPDIPLPSKKKKKGGDIRSDTGSSSIQKRKKKIPELRKDEISPLKISKEKILKKKSKFDGFVDSLEKTFIEKEKEKEKVVKDRIGNTDIANFKRKMDEERKRLIGDINRKLIEDLRKTRKV